MARSALLVAILVSLSCGDDETTNNDTGSAQVSSSQTASSTAGGTAGMGGAGASGGVGANGGGGGGGGHGGTGGAPAPYDGVACLKCIDPLVKSGQKCETAYTGCQGTADCNAWLNCINDCFQPSSRAGCWDDCDAAHAPGKDDFDAFYACVCPDCGALCGTACN